MRFTLSLYILRQHVGPFLFAILVITFLFIMDTLIDFIDLFLGKGIAFPVVAEVFLLSLGWMVALTVPMSTLVATVMAFGRLAGRHEIMAMHAAGVGIYGIIAPPLVVSVLLTGALVEFNNRVLPESNHRLAGLLVDIHRKKPALAIKEGMFNDVRGYTIRVEKLNPRTSRIRGVTIQRTTKDDENQTIVAEKGRLEFSEGGNVLSLYLTNGEIHALDEKDPTRYHKMTFDTHTIHIRDIGTELVRSEKKTRGDRELSAGKMLERVEAFRREIEAIRQERRETIRSHLTTKMEVLKRPVPSDSTRRSTDTAVATRSYAREIRNFASRLTSKSAKIRERQKQIDRYMVEVHKKYALPVACIVFVLAGAPLGVRARRGGLGVGLGFSIAFFALYYLFLMGGEDLADRGYLSPGVAMWAANAIIGSLGIFLVYHATKEMSAFRFPFPRHRRRNAGGGARR